MKRRFSVFCVAFLALFLTQLSMTARAEQNAQTGVAEGVLVAKGDAWIAVRADGEEKATQLVPRWVGGLPKNGGGLDKRILAMIRELVVGSRLKVAWQYDEKMRVVDIQVLSLPGQEQGDGKNETPPAQKEGSFIGVVTGKDAKSISIRPDGEQESKKFFPRWIGGMPKDGGGLDKDALRAIQATPVNAHVQVAWIWDERLRLTGLQIVK